MKLNMLDLNKLHVFGAVVEHGGVSGAAARLGRTPSAVSQSVSGLEATLGAKLFDRVGRQLVLTRGGQVLYGHLRESLGALQRVVDEVVDAGGGLHGAVRLGVYLGFPRLRLAGFLAAFAARHSRVELRVVYAPHQDLRARLLRNQLDFAVALPARGAPAPMLAATPLFEEELVLVGSPRFIRRRFDLAALGATPVIDYYRSDPLIERWIAHHYGAGAVQPRVAIWAATTDLVLDLLLGHAGVGVLPRDVAAAALRRRRLAVVRGAHAPLTDRIWLNERRGAYRDRTLTEFRAAVLREFGGTGSEKEEAI
jgi:DNA-binding transcriptional LysR family regulator